MRALLLLDHDNIPYGDVSFHDIVNKLHPPRHTEEPSAVTYMHVRAYGGWFDDTIATSRRFSASDFYQQHCPSVLRTSSGVICRLSFEFADGLLKLPHNSGVSAATPLITHTVAVRNTPQYIQRRAAAGECTYESCELPKVKAWVKKKRACAVTGCPHMFESFFERREQKQVDVHMAVDLLSATLTKGFDHVAVASDDWDLLPAVLAASHYRTSATALSIIRFATTPSYLDDALTTRGVNIVWMRIGDS